jgi:hypothetical protein
VFVCQYEVFFSGTNDQRIGRFLLLLDFLGVKRFGKLPPEQVASAFKKVLYFIDPGRQKMNYEDSMRHQVINYDELRKHYEAWTMISYS